MKKSILWTIVLVLILSFCACGNSSEEQQQGDNARQGQQKEQSEQQEQGQLEQGEQNKDSGAENEKENNQECSDKTKPNSTFMHIDFIDVKPNEQKVVDSAFLSIDSLAVKEEIKIFDEEHPFDLYFDGKRGVSDNGIYFWTLDGNYTSYYKNMLYMYGYTTLKSSELKSGPKENKTYTELEYDQENDTFTLTLHRKDGNLGVQVITNKESLYKDPVFTEVLKEKGVSVDYAFEHKGHAEVNGQMLSWQWNDDNGIEYIKGKLAGYNYYLGYAGSEKITDKEFTFEGTRVMSSDEYIIVQYVANGVIENYRAKYIDETVRGYLDDKLINDEVVYKGKYDYYIYFKKSEDVSRCMDYLASKAYGIYEEYDYKYDPVFKPAYAVLHYVATDGTYEFCYSKGNGLYHGYTYYPSAFCYKDNSISVPSYISEALFPNTSFEQLSFNRFEWYTSGKKYDAFKSILLSKGYVQSDYGKSKKTADDATGLQGTLVQYDANGDSFSLGQFHGDGTCEGANFFKESAIPKSFIKEDLFNESFFQRAGRENYSWTYDNIDNRVKADDVILSLGYELTEQLTFVAEREDSHTYTTITYITETDSFDVMNKNKDGYIYRNRYKIATQAFPTEITRTLFGDASFSKSEDGCTWVLSANNSDENTVTKTINELGYILEKSCVLSEQSAYREINIYYSNNNKFFSVEYTDEDSRRVRKEYKKHASEVSLPSFITVDFFEKAEYERTEDTVSWTYNEIKDLETIEQKLGLYGYNFKK